jgi:hypothetical protein
VSSERGKSRQCALTLLGCSKGGFDEVREVVAELWEWYIGRWCDDERTRRRRSARRRRQLGFFRSASTERQRDKGRSEVEAASWRSRRPLGLDRWGHGRRTVTTARPRGSRGLRSVGHFPPYPI